MSDKPQAKSETPSQKPTASTSHIKKAKTHKGKVFLESFLPKIIEDPKSCLFINTNNSGEMMRMVQKDLYLTRKDYSKQLSHKNAVNCVFNDFNSAGNVQFLCQKNNSSLFTYTSDTKKRPMNLVMGSLFNDKLLDIFEFEVKSFIPLEYFAKNVKIDSCMRPLIIFQGDLFETDFEYDRIRKFFLDYFRLHEVEELNISDLRRIMIISVAEDKEILLRNYQIEGDINEYTIKSFSSDHQGSKIKSNLDLTEVGPSLNLKLRRTKLADESLYKISLKQPKELLGKKEKNIENNMLGEKRGRVYMERQNLNNMALRNYKKILNKKNKFNKKEEEENK